MSHMLVSATSNTKNLTYATESVERMDILPRGTCQSSCLCVLHVFPASVIEKPPFSHADTKPRLSVGPICEPECKTEDMIRLCAPIAVGWARSSSRLAATTTNVFVVSLRVVVAGLESAET